MTKIRIILLLITLLVVGTVGSGVILYAKGYRFDTEKRKLVTSGLLVVKSLPDSAQVFIDGELETATNATISLAPGTYDIEVKKDGFHTWGKRLAIEAEVVTETTANLFRTAPSLTAITFTGAVDPIISPDRSKIAYGVLPEPTNKSDIDKQGLWILETLDLPLGFTRDPRRVTDANVTNSTWKWSPDGRELLLTTGANIFRIDVGEYTSQKQLINVSTNYEEILEEWNAEYLKRIVARTKKLPNELIDVLKLDYDSVIVSPDSDLVLYTSSVSVTLPKGLIEPLPGSSTQAEERNLEEGSTYVYDVDEDKNFLVTRESTPLSWLPTSRHLLFSEDNRVSIIDYDATNRQAVYEGSYVAPYAFSTVSSNVIIILTNLGANGDTPHNLYSLGVK